MNEEMPEAVQSEDSYFASLPNSESINIKQLLDIEIEKHDVALRGASKKGKVYEDGFVAGLKHVRENLVGLRVVEVDDIPEVSRIKTEQWKSGFEVGVRINDAWHPASQPPKPEDFEPTGKIDVDMDDGSVWIWTKGGIPLPIGAKNWRKITPPKP